VKRDKLGRFIKGVKNPELGKLMKEMYASGKLVSPWRGHKWSSNCKPHTEETKQKIKDKRKPMVAPKIIPTKLSPAIGKNPVAKSVVKPNMRNKNPPISPPRIKKIIPPNTPDFLLLNIFKYTLKLFYI